MDYSLGFNDPFMGEEITNQAEVVIPKLSYSNNDFEFVRRGEPNGGILYASVTKDIERLLSFFSSQGYSRDIPRLSNKEFERHVCLFRAQLDLWENFSTTKVFSKEEIYYRCLAEGPQFTEYIKSCRGTSFRAKTTETPIDIDEETFCDTYDGYNSIIHERYLIHWDDRDTVDDVKYAFMPVKPIDEEAFRSMFKALLNFIKVEKKDFDVSISLLDSMKNTKMYDPVTKKTSLMREFWNEDIDLSTPYSAKRTVVLTFPGSTRDTGIGDASTVAKVKFINKLCRAVSEKCPYSANCTSATANLRYLRVLKRNMFIHLDFKKFGLAFPRALSNIALEEICKIAGVDSEDLLIKNFFIEIDGQVYETERGTCLGWIDCLNALCVQAILHYLAIEEDLKFDHINFNDDVEISMWKSGDPTNRMEMTKLALISVFTAFDVPISIKKTYGSFGSVFLERYSYYQENYQLDMYKEQLTVKAFALSLVTTYPWKAKLYFSGAWQWTKIEYARERCIASCPIEFREEEKTSPVLSGGWYSMVESGLDLGVRESDHYGLCLAMELTKFRLPKYSVKPVQVSTNQEIAIQLERNSRRANPPHAAREVFAMEETLQDINFEADSAGDSVMLLTMDYSGRDDTFPIRVARVVDRWSTTGFQVH